MVKDLVSPLLWLRSLLWRRFEPWPGNFHMLWVQPIKLPTKSPNTSVLNADSVQDAGGLTVNKTDTGACGLLQCFSTKAYLAIRGFVLAVAAVGLPLTSGE